MTAAWQGKKTMMEADMQKTDGADAQEHACFTGEEFSVPNQTGNRLFLSSHVFSFTAYEANRS